VEQHAQIQTHESDPAPIIQTLDGAPVTVSMLVDPRGVVHATSGILPAKYLEIPPDQYVPALRAIEVAFLTTPILTRAGSLALPLPVEPGYEWSWLADGTSDSGKVAPADGTSDLGKVDLTARFSGPQEIREGWLKLTQRQGTPGS
jgi:hypothetical protein